MYENIKSIQVQANQHTLFQSNKGLDQQANYCTFMFKEDVTLFIIYRPQLVNRQNGASALEKR